MSNQKNELAIFNADSMNSLIKFADLMSQGAVALPEHLRNKPADCMAIAMQAAQWGMNPYAVAQKTHIVNGQLGYEAQLVNAVVSSSRSIVGRFKYEAIGDWSKWQYQQKNVTMSGKGGSTYQKKVHGGINEQGLGVRVGAVLAGETEVTWDDVVYIAPVVNRNSPLWESRPLQQLKYLALKYWARIYAPDVILGVYDKEELESFDEKQERDITPQRDRKPTAAMLNDAFSGNGNISQDQLNGDDVIESSEAEIEPEVINSEPTIADKLEIEISEQVDPLGWNNIKKKVMNAMMGELIDEAEAEKLRILLNAKKAEILEESK